MKIKNGVKMYDNFAHVEGWIYDASRISYKETGANSKNPGTKYIGGSIDIATNDELTNIVTVNFTYERPVKPWKDKQTGADIPNDNWTILSEILDARADNRAERTVLGVGKEGAICVKIDGRVAANEYYSDKTGEKKLVSFNVIDGSFMKTITPSDMNREVMRRSTFTTDILINNVKIKEADPDKGLDEKALVSGYIFNYDKSLIPVTFDVVNEDAIGYFDGLGASNSNPIFIKIAGSVINEVVKVQTTSSCAWGSETREVERNNRSWRITWGQEPYDFDSEETITAKELKELLANRKTVEAGLSARFDNRNAAKSTTTVSNGGFDF